MIIRILMCFGLCGAATAAEPASSPFAPPTVGVLVKFERRPSSMFSAALQHQVKTIFRPSGLDLQWELLGENKQPGTYDRVVIIEMRGSCNPNRPVDSREAGDPRMPLGWTIVSDGEVLPYAMVDCDRIRQAISGAHRGRPDLALPAMYNRLAGRVLAHELMHALLRTSQHRESDCMRSPLRPMDLQTEPRLQPGEIAALRGMMQARGETLAQRD